jgi:hypothetical protein
MRMEPGAAPKMQDEGMKPGEGGRAMPDQPGDMKPMR